MQRDQRALLAVTGLALGGPPRLRLLYRSLDAAAALLARRLARAYGHAVVLRGREATLAAVASAAARLSTAPGVVALDVFLNVHGRVPTVTLADREVPVSVLATALAGGEPGGARPRLLYSTACHAATHAPALRAAGFRACVGARCVNATGGFETPVFLALWARGVPVGRVLGIADHPVARRPADAVARVVLRAAGERGLVDSEKELEGDGAVTIDTVP